MDLRTHVVDLLFIVTRMHQKIKALFFRINFDYYKKFCKKNVFLSIFFSLKYIKRKKKNKTLNSIGLQNLTKFNIYLIIVMYFVNFMNFVFILTFFLLKHKTMYTRKLIITLNFSFLPLYLFSKFFFFLLYVYNFSSSFKYQSKKKYALNLKVFIYLMIFVFVIHTNLVTQKISYCKIIYQSHKRCSFFLL